MSLKTAHIAQNPYLYPVGNTPAVCLTDNIAPEIDAKVLLLGCGDIRNVLFTMYSGAGSDDRKLDFTCCDIEAEIIARNIVALTLIVNDKDGAHFQQAWNIYYHVFVDPQSMSILQAHTKSLLDYAQSLETWSKGPYASLIHFCDETTFKAVVKLWKLYATEPSSGKGYASIQTLLKNQWKAAQRHQSNRVGESIVLDGLRAAAPVLSEASADASKLYRTFWATGTCLDDTKITSKFTVANPMFGCLRSGLLLHYGQSPLTGFHLAPAYTSLATNSPLTGKSANKLWPTCSRALQVAFEQFTTWSIAFRKNSNRVTVRFVNADALAFCHVLQHQQTHAHTKDAQWYRNPWSFELLALSKAEYAPHGSAPMTFNVIDTSNLMDHLGSLNILAAAGPLLEYGPTSTLRTQMMLPREANIAESAQKLLCGDLPTVASLLRLNPIQYWTNATTTWEMNKAMLRNVSGADQALSTACKPIIIWKPLDLSAVRYDASELARFLYGVYLQMYADESWSGRFSMLNLLNKDLLQKKLQTYDLYTRASLTALLRCIKTSNVVEWTPFIQELVAGFILNDPSLNMGPHHFQSFCAHLEMLSLVQLDQVFDWWHPRTFVEDLRGPFQSWSNIPPVVCVTLVVPHKAVTMFDDISKGNGTPLCQMQLQSSLSGKEASYPDIQLDFGTVQTSGKAFTNQYRVTVTPDTEGWKGESPLIVSAVVSTCSLVEHGDTAARVIFALKSTTSNAACFTSELGLFLHLHQSVVGHEDVFISQYRPNTTGHMSVGSIRPPQSASSGIATVTIKPFLTGTHVASVQVRYDVTSEAARLLLQNAAPVVVEQPGPFELTLDIDSALDQGLKIPFPLKTTAAKTRIARQQSWIEFTAPVADMQFLAARPDAVFSVDMQKGYDVCSTTTTSTAHSDSSDRKVPSLDHLAYVDSDSLPKLHLDTSLWLIMHTPSIVTMSGSEYKEYEKVRADQSLTMPGRLGVKETVHCMYVRTVGLCGLPRSNWFCLTSSTGVVCILLVDCIRMDLSHQSVFLDAALLPPQAGSGCAYLGILFAALVKNLVRVSMDEEERIFWKHLLPAFAERCRQWRHKDTCEYQAAGRMPISTKDDKPFICSCGAGIFPKGYLASTKPFKEVANLAVRVAIPVIFASPISKDDQRFPLSGARTEGTKPKKGGCLKCGAATTKAGKRLLKCSKCKTAQYCSPECQKMDWKKHKQGCKQVQEKGVGDDAA